MPPSIKIIIIGNGGTGKSIVGNKLSRDTGIPVMHLDKLAWKDGYELVPLAEFKQQLTELFKEDQIILEGWSKQETMLDRIIWADIIIYLRYPLENCLETLLNRNKEFSGKPYPFDNFTGDREAMNELYIKAVESVHYECEPEARQWMESQPNKTIVTYTSFEELNQNYSKLLSMLKQRMAGL